MIIIASMAETRDTHHILKAESRSALLALLRAMGRPLSVTEAAEQIGLRPSTTRFHLDLLASAGLVDRTVERRAAAGRPRIHYTARPAGDDLPFGEYEGLAGALADQLSGTPDPVAAAREAGRRWTETLGIAGDGVPATPDEAIVAVAGHMDRLGFAPDRPSGMDRINLRHCPFEAVARRQRGVVCGVHAGMLEETFRRLGGAVEVERLDAFANDEPLLCVVHLQRVSRAGTNSHETPEQVDNGGAARSGRRRPGRKSRGLADA